MKKYHRIHFLILLFAACIKAHAQVVTSDSIHLRSDSIAGFSMLDSAVGAYKVFITGENHSYLESNSRMWVQQIKYLHKNAGVRNVMIEYGYASGWLINEYIHTGDSILFNVLKAYSFGEYSNAYRELHQFNASLEPENRVSVFGIDLERGVYSASKVLSLQLPANREAPDSIELDVESLKSLVKYTDMTIGGKLDDYELFNAYSAVNTLDRILTNFNAHPNLWKSYLGEKYEVFKRILKGFADMQTWKSYEKDNSTHQFVYREKYMFDRFKDEFQNRQGNFFGQFGRCHSAKSAQEQTSCNWYEFRSLASRIEESQELGLNQKVMTMGILYADDEYDDDVWASIQSTIDDLFEAMPANRVVLYNIKADSNLYPTLKEYFDFVYLNTTAASKTYPYRSNDDNEVFDSVAKDPAPRTKVLAYAGLLNLDLNGLNEYLNLNSKFLGQLTMLGAEIVTVSDRSNRIISNMTFGSILKQMLESQNTVLDRNYDFELRGFFFNNFTGFNLTKNNPALDIMPGLGFGYSQLRLKIVEYDNDRQLRPDEGFLGHEKLSEYLNPAFNFSLCSELDFNIKSFTAGATGGYQFDLSKKRWIASELLGEGPETSLRGWFAQFHLGFNFSNLE